MTDAPNPAAAAPAPTGRRRGPVAPRPDDRQPLLAAIERRDGPRARRLAERWVHRRGVASLVAFQREVLGLEAGPEACGWLADLLGAPVAPVAAPLRREGAAALGPAIGLEDLDPPAAGPSPLPSVDEAFAALAAEFAPHLADGAPSLAELDHIARGGLDQVDPSLLPPPPPSLSFAIAAAAPAAESPAPSSAADSAAAAGPAAAPAADERGGAWFGRVRGLLRARLEEVIGTRRASDQPGTSEADPDAGATNSKAAQLSAEPAQLSAASPPEPLPSAAPAVDGLPASGPSAGPTAGPTAGPVADPGVPEPEAAAEPLAPWPTFHPTASILAVLPDPPTAEAPAPGRWLPRLGLVPPAPRPAPAPSDLADLRAWLPDAADDLPRAC